MKLRRRRSVSAALLLVSCSAIALAVPSAADAACSPNPAQPATPTKCTGTETNGLVIGQSGVTATIDAGASVTAPAGVDAVLIAPAPPNSYNYYPYASLDVSGTIDGGTQSGIVAHPGPTPIGGYPYFTTNVAISVGAAGTIAGATGILLTDDPSNLNAQTSVSLVNSGTISGSSGLALDSRGAKSAYFSSISNRSSGKIGAISAGVLTLNNAGEIDGGNRSAINLLSSVPAYYSSNVTNSGTIRSNSATATILFGGTGFYPAVTNSGSIVNSGSGEAIRSALSLTVDNSAGATISSAGPVAVRLDSFGTVLNAGTITGDIVAAGNLQLTNTGVVAGSVTSTSLVAGPGYGGTASVVNNSHGGQINGNVTLGAGDDLVAVDFGTSAQPVSGIAGTVDAGGGLNTLQLTFLGDTTLTAPIILPATFGQLNYSISNGKTLTLGSGFTQGTTIRLAGDATYGSGSTLVNNATIATVGPAFQQVGYGNYLTFVNNGSVSATLAASYFPAISFNSVNQFTNNGTITATAGAGVSLSGGGASTNGGLIVADGTALDLFNTPFTNGGKIQSLQGIGLAASGSGTQETNDGTITGATVGAAISNVTLINRGTISSPGLGVALQPYATLDNRAGATVSGGIRGSLYGFTFNARLINAGTINGNVDFGNFLSYYGSNNTFIAAPGGVLNGNLNLGSGYDTFVTSLINTGPGLFAGVTGTVSGGGNESLRYLVDQTASASLVPPSGVFTRLGYEVSPGATLTLTAPAVQSLPISFSGSGSVDLTADLSGNGMTILDLTAPSVFFTSYPPIANSLSLISRGTLTEIHDQNYSYAAPAVLTGSATTFTNAGTIIARDLVPISPYATPLAAIAGGGTIVNSGTISLDGAIGINTTYSNPTYVTNNGTISELSGAAASQGIVGMATILNSGSIVTGGAAVTLGAGYNYGTLGKLTNSGTIRSTGGAAVTGPSNPYSYYGTATVINQASGTITGLGTAIRLPGGLVDNAGSIVGDVSFACPIANYCYAQSSGAYIARGGTLTGNLSFGSGDDLFVSNGNTTGVSGTIDGGAGTNTYARGYFATTTVAAGATLPTSFQREGIGAFGSGTVVTVTGPVAGRNQGILYLGDGQIINQVNVNAAPLSSYNRNTVFLADAAGNANGTGTLDFSNQAILADGVSGTARSFINSGTVGSASLNGAALSLIVGGPNFTFVNSGAILDAGNNSCSWSFGCGSPGVSFFQRDFYLPGATMASATLSNSGSIADSLLGSFNATDVSFTNTGTIRATGGRYGVDLNALPQALLDSVTGTTHSGDQGSTTFTNTGSVTGGVALSSSAVRLTVANSGTVTAPAVSSYGTYGSPNAAMFLRQTTVGDQAVDVTNSGTVSSYILGSAGIAIATVARASGAGAPLSRSVSGPTSSITITNTGTLTANGGASSIDGYSIDPQAGYAVVHPGDNVVPPAQLIQPAVIRPATALIAVATSEGASQVTVANGATGIIAAIAPAGDPFASGASTALVASADTVSITNNGLIAGGKGITNPASTIFSLGATIFPDSYFAGAIQTFASTDTVINGRTGTITGSIDLGDLNDRIENFGTINGDVFLRSGDDTFVQGLGGTLNGEADGGTGSNNLVFDLTGGGLLDNTLLAKFINFTTPTFTGSGEIRTNGLLPFSTLVLNGGTLTVAAGQTLQTSGPVTITTDNGTNGVINLGTIAGGISFGGGSNSLTNGGRIGGPVAFGTGGSRLTVLSGASFGGAVTTGGTNNLLTLAMGGSDLVPDEINLTGVTGFQRTRQISGTAALSGSFTTGMLDILAGRLIGREGSTITAPTINVASGATFGSAGTVVGNVAVAGTLSPGASPGTMIVIGNVALASGSNTLFELTPTVSDQLLISGTLGIAAGSTLTLTGNRPLTPGRAYDLIVANGGISGNFTTVSQGAGVLGFLAQRSDRIQLLGLFAVDPAFNPQLTATANGLNSVLTSSPPSEAFLSALPTLLTPAGSTNAGALAMVNPEAYASSTQIGVENGLAIAGSMRGTIAAGAHADNGLFIFAKAVAASRRLNGSIVAGTSRASIDSRGLIAGIGWGSGSGSLTAFGGVHDGRQRIDALGARIKATGAVFGITGAFVAHGLAAQATLAYDDSSANTSRPLPGTASAVGDYRLRSLIADAQLGYSIPLSGSLSAVPSIGFTHIETRRGATTETGGSPLALAIASGKNSTDFIDGEVRLQSTLMTARFKPWVAFGVRHQLDGRDTSATANFVGTTVPFMVAGAGRSVTLATAQVGFDWQVSGPVSLTSSYRGEFANRSTGHDVSAGVRVRF